MNGASAPVTSRQTSVHSSLEANVRKHAQTAWLKPVAGHSKAAFEALANEVEAWPGPLVLDTGCGTGLSTAVLALRHPDCLVLGIDKSVARLDRHAGLLPGNARLVRMDLEDLWLQAAPAGWRFQRQCFFYPNPWPKPAQRLRRWPFHPVLPVALACGGVWEVRTNWEVYAREFALAFSVLTGRTPTVEPWRPEEPETLFERKYLASGHALWRWEEPSGPAAGPGR